MNSTHPSERPASLPQSPVLRRVAFPVPAFDYLKDWQRNYSDKHGVWLDNGQALAAILREHEAQNPLSNGRGVRRNDLSSSR